MKRAPVVPGEQFVRGFILGQIYERRMVITTASIRRLGVSKATAKRYMAQIRKLVPVASSRQVGRGNHQAQRTLNDVTTHDASARRMPRSSKPDGAISAIEFAYSLQHCAINAITCPANVGSLDKPRPRTRRLDAGRPYNQEDGRR